MVKKIKWYCSQCKKFVDNPKPAGISVVGVVGQMSCDVCEGWLMEIRRDKWL